MTAPRTGPLIRAHAIGGPAWSSVVGVMPGTTSMRRAHVDQDGLGGREPPQRLAVGGVDLVPPERRHRVGSRRAPVHAAHRDAAAAERVGEEIDAGVDDAQLRAEEPALSGHGGPPARSRASSAASRFVGQTRAPASRSFPSWSASPWGSSSVPTTCATTSSVRRARRARARASPIGGRQRAGRVRMGAVAEDHVHQHAPRRPDRPRRARRPRSGGSDR